TRVTGALTDFRVPIEFLNVIPGSVGTVAFGRYLSPDYQIHSGEYIPPVATRTGTPVVQRMNEVYFNLFLPAGPEPAGGWPGAIFGPAPSAHKNEDPRRGAADNAAHGIATIAIIWAGNGFGPLSTLTVNQTTASPMTFLAGGRSVDQNGDGIIGGTEGQLAAAPPTVVGETGGPRQAGAGLMQLLRGVQVGGGGGGVGPPEPGPSRSPLLGG